MHLARTFRFTVLVLILGFSILVPFFATISAFAQTSSVASCVSINDSMRVGSVDRNGRNQVAALQKFLVANNYLDHAKVGANYGIFGSLTKAAVTKFQKAAGLNLGNDYGIVGPITRGLVLKVSCGGAIPSKLQGTSSATSTKATIKPAATSTSPTSSSNSSMGPSTYPPGGGGLFGGSQQSLNPTGSSTGSSLTFTYPTGGEVFVLGDAVTLRWETVGTIPTVDIYARINQGIYIVRDLPNTGSYVWTIPSNARTGDYPLRIVASTGDLPRPTDESEYFTVAETMSIGYGSNNYGSNGYGQ